MPMMPGLLLRKRISSFLFVVCVWWDLHAEWEEVAHAPKNHEHACG